MTLMISPSKRLLFFPRVGAIALLILGWPVWQRAGSCPGLAAAAPEVEADLKLWRWSGVHLLQTFPESLCTSCVEELHRKVG